tara:strand:+ start:940 stop:2490 length:1551 start_codon:yes stop_codon:yes gene_type:complete
MSKSGKKMTSICDENICQQVKEDINQAAKKDGIEQIMELNRIYANYLGYPNKCIFKRNPDGTNLRLWSNLEYRNNPSIQKLYNIFTQRITTDCLMNEFITDNKCELKDIQAIAGIMNQGSEDIKDIDDINDILKTLKLDNSPGLKSGGKLTMKGGNISLFKKFFKINTALMYNDALMTAMYTASEDIITKYINAGIKVYSELVTFAFENAYDVQCQKDFLFYLIRNTVSGFYTIKEDIWPFIMANTPILINDIRKGIDTANTVAENIDNRIAQYINEKNKESNQRALADHLGKITTEKLDEEFTKALERDTRLRTIRNMYEKKITELKIDTEEIQKEQQDADEETNLIKSYEQEFAEAFEANQMAKKALNEVKDELQETIDNAIFDNTQVNISSANALKSGRKVASEVYPHTNSVLDFFPTNEKKKTQKENVLTTKLRKAREEEEEEEEEEDNNEQQQAVTTAQQQGIRGVKRKTPGDNIGGGTRKKRTSRKGKKKASKNRKTKARRARKSRKTKK